MPVNLVKQWIDKIENSFTIPYILLDNINVFEAAECENPFEQDAVIITTYDFAVEKSDYINRLKWDLIILDEAAKQLGMTVTQKQMFKQEIETMKRMSGKPGNANSSWQELLEIGREIKEWFK